MSTPQQSGPPTSSSGAWTIALIVLAVVGVMMLICCGGLAFLGGLFYTRAERVAAQVKTAVQTGRVPANPGPAWQSEWLAMSQLMPVYSAAIDAVATDKSVLEKLGEPIEPSGESDSLFRREKKGDWTGGEETIEFDVQGSQGKAVVRVAAGMPAASVGPRVANRGMWPTSISVVFEDGSKVEVPAPAADDVP
jgi:hypothetical protein